MRKILFTLIIWSSLVLAEDPPEMPFRPLDQSMMPRPNAKVQNDIPQKIENDQPHQDQSQTIEKDHTNAPPQKKEKDKAQVTLINKNQEIDLGFQSGIIIKPKPGRTESAIIARDKLNPITTPFANPKVITVDSFESKVDGSVVYISTSGDKPINMFISEADDSQVTAVSLQLVPQDLPASVQIKIEAVPSITSTVETASLRSGAITRHEEPYIADIKTIMQSLGKQQIPQGFTLEEMINEPRLTSICHDPNLTFRAGQILTGHDSKIVIMIAQNNKSIPSVFEESFCAGENVLAVAAWPRVRLEAGEKTEVFILMRMAIGKSNEEFRPPLL